VLILACGTSYYAGCVAKYWLESVAGMPCQVEIASEYRYRDLVPDPDTLVVTISQSGETADTLAALRHAQGLGMRHTLTICNVATSAMVRECKLAYSPAPASRSAWPAPRPSPRSWWACSCSRWRWPGRADA
jgi:glucosamine--fructose-6-phosphate aminotransferase (isomerizing)